MVTLKVRVLLLRVYWAEHNTKVFSFKALDTFVMLGSRDWDRLGALQFAATVPSNSAEFIISGVSRSGLHFVKSTESVKSRLSSRSSSEHMYLLS